MRYGRLMVAEGTRVTPSPGNKASGQNYLRIRLAGGREIGKRAEQLAQIGRLRYVCDGDVEGASRLLREAVRLDPRFARPYIHLARIACPRCTASSPPTRSRGRGARSRPRPIPT